MIIRRISQTQYSTITTQKYVFLSLHLVGVVINVTFLSVSCLQPKTTNNTLINRLNLRPAGSQSDDIFALMQCLRARNGRCSEQASTL
jgi:hypothetical protein